MSNPRVGARLSVKLSTGNYSSVGLEFWEERDVSDLTSAQQTRAAILERLTQEIGDWKKQDGTEIPKSPPKFSGPEKSTPPTAPSKPEARSVAGVTDQDIEGELDQLDWMDNKKHTGWFTPIEELPFTIKAALINRFNANTTKSLRIGGYNYTRFGEDNGLIGRFPVKAA